MEVYRLSKEKYVNNLNGKGSSISGGRWNSKGIESIYVASSRALAMAEIIVHLPGGMLRENYKVMVIYLPDDISLHKINIRDLPNDWNTFPHPATTQILGDKLFIENKYCVFQVPSVVVKGEFIFLINPKHEEFKKVKIVDIEDFLFDTRVLR